MIDGVLYQDANERGLPLTISGASTSYSKVFGGNDAVNWSTHLVWTGTLNGTLTLWASNKPNPNLATDADWVSVTLPSGLSGPNGSAGSSFADIGNSAGRAYRLKFVYSAGSGDLSGWWHGKKASA